MTSIASARLRRFMMLLVALATLCGGHQAARADSALSLNGSADNDYLSLPSGTIPDSNVTITMWIRPESYGPNWPELAFWGPQIGCFPSVQMFVIDENGKLVLFTGCEFDARVIGTTTVTLGAWQHVAVTIDASGNAVLYFNGAADGSGNARGGAFVVGGNDLIGARWSGGVISTGGSDGAIDEVQIYGRVLSPAEISELYHAGQGLCGAVAGGGLLAGYHLDEGEGTTAADFSGNGKDGTLINNAGWIASSVAAGCTDTGFVTRVGLAASPSGSQDVVEFLATDTLYLTLRQVDLAAQDPADRVVEARVIQNDSSGKPVKTVRTNLKPQPDGSFTGSVVLAQFPPGELSIVLRGTTASGTRIIVHESKIVILP